MNRNAVALCVTLAIALVTSACGDGGGDDVLGLGDRNLDRCSLVSAQEAEQWLGGAVSAAPSDGIDGEPDPITCLYKKADAFTSFLIQVYDGEVFFAEVGSASRNGETIDGLGEDAWVGDGKVQFLQNDWSASVSRISGTIPEEGILEIAKLMSSRLP